MIANLETMVAVSYKVEVIRNGEVIHTAFSDNYQEKSTDNLAKGDKDDCNE